MKTIIAMILIILSISSPSFAYTLYTNTNAGITISNPGTKTTFTNLGYIQSVSSTTRNIAYIMSSPFTFLVTSAPATILLTRSGGTETATATMSYRMMSANYPMSVVDGINANLGTTVSSTDSGQWWGVAGIVTQIAFTQTPVAGTYISASQAFSLLDGTTKSAAFTVKCLVQTNSFAISELLPLTATFLRKAPANAGCFAGTAVQVGAVNPCFNTYGGTNADYGVIGITYPAGVGNVSVRIVPNIGDTADSNNGSNHVLTSENGATISWQSQIRISNMIASQNVATVQASCTLTNRADGISGTVGGNSTFNSKSAGSYAFCWGLSPYSSKAFPTDVAVNFSDATAGTYRASYSVIVDTY